MSVVTQYQVNDPQLAWILGALPLAVTLDLALGDLPGRTYVVRGLNWLIEIVEGGVQATIARVGGGRGGELFGGLLLAGMVVGTTASCTWLLVDLGDTIGGVGTLAVRTVVIAAGLVIRATGDRILHAAEANDRVLTRQWLERAGGSPVLRLDGDGSNQVCVAATAELTSAAIVAPLCWLSLGGPAAMWGYLAIHSLRLIQPVESSRDSLTARVPTVLANLAEALPALLTWSLMSVAAAIVRLHPAQAWRTGWREGRSHPGAVVLWSQATMAGALGVRLVGGRVFRSSRFEPRIPVGESIRDLDGLAVVRSIRLMQVTALLAAGCAALITTLLW